MFYIIPISLFIIFLTILNNQFTLFTFRKKKVRILMYHSVNNNDIKDPILLTLNDFEKQIDYLVENNYQFVTAKEFINNTIPKKAVLLTFDDGFLDNYELVLPVLKKYNITALIFLVLGKLGKQMDWSEMYTKYNLYLMNEDQLKKAEPYFEYAYHTFDHKNYEFLSLEEIEEDLKKCISIADKLSVKLLPLHAFTFGGYYRKKNNKQSDFFALFKKYKFKYIFRVGNRIESINSKSFLLNRIDIRGTDNFETFKTKIKFGRNKFF